jgi:hypothetical protein
MKTKLQAFALAVMCMSATITHSQTLNDDHNYADQLISSSGVINPQNAVDDDRNNYAVIRAEIGVLNHGALKVGFSQPGEGGQLVVLQIQNDNGLLGADVLQSISVKVFDSDGNAIVDKNGFGVADAQIIQGTSTYKVFINTKNSALDIKSVRIRVSGLATLANRLRVYNVWLIDACPRIHGDAVYAKHNVQDAQNAVSPDKNDFALLTPPLVAGTSYLDISFPQPGYGGKNVAFYLGRGNTIISAQLLKNITLKAYDTNGDVVAERSGFTGADVRVLPGGQFELRLHTPKGKYGIRRGRIKFSGLVNVLTTLKVYKVVVGKACNAGKEEDITASDDDKTAPAIDLQVSPNPFSSYTTLNIKSVLKNPAYITISDKSGNLIETHQVSGAASLRLLEKAPAGVYFVKIVSGNFVATRKVIKM